MLGDNYKYGEPHHKSCFQSCWDQTTIEGVTGEEQIVDMEDWETTKELLTKPKSYSLSA